MFQADLMHSHKTVTHKKLSTRRVSKTPLHLLAAQVRGAASVAGLHPGVEVGRRVWSILNGLCNKPVGGTKYTQKDKRG